MVEVSILSILKKLQKESEAGCGRSDVRISNSLAFSCLDPLGLISARFVRRTSVIPIGLSSAEHFKLVPLTASLASLALDSAIMTCLCDKLQAENYSDITESEVRALFIARKYQSLPSNRLIS
jgi:hypothetical protein